MENHDENKKKDEVNYEKLFINIVELKHESKKTIEIFSQFFNNYITKNESCNSKEIMELISQVEENKKAITANIALEKRIILEKNKKRLHMIESQNNFLRNYLHISHVLNKNKKICKYKILLIIIKLIF